MSTSSTNLVKIVASLVREVGIEKVSKELGILAMISSQYSIDEGDLVKSLKSSKPNKSVADVKSAVKTKTAADASDSSILIENYTEKSIVLRGEGTRSVIEDLKKLGAKWNTSLEGGKGWILPKTKKDELFAQLTISGVVYEDKTSDAAEAKEPAKPSKAAVAETIRITAKNDEGRKVLTACLKKIDGGKYDAAKKIYTFPASSKTRIENTMVKLKGEYEIFGSTTVAAAKKTKIVKNPKTEGTYWDPETKIAFEKREDTLIAIGKQGDDEMEALDEDAIELCNSRKWKYDPPQNAGDENTNDAQEGNASDIEI